MPERVVKLFLSECPHCQLQQVQVNTTEPAVIVADGIMEHFEVCNNWDITITAIAQTPPPLEIKSQRRRQRVGAAQRKVFVSRIRPKLLPKIR